MRRQCASNGRTLGASGARPSWALPRALAILPMYLCWFRQARGQRGRLALALESKCGLWHVWNATDRCSAHAKGWSVKECCTEGSCFKPPLCRCACAGLETGGLHRPPPARVLLQLQVIRQQRQRRLQPQKRPRAARASRPRPPAERHRQPQPRRTATAGRPVSPRRAASS